MRVREGRAVIQDPRKAQTKQSGKKNKWYAYLGGGAVDSEQTELLSGLVINTKNWQWAALTVVASWFLSCSCECGELSWPNKARIIATEAWEETVDPLDGGGEENRYSGASGRGRRPAAAAAEARGPLPGDVRAVPH